MESQDMEYAGFWIRVGASLIDTVLLVMVTGPILTMIYGDAYWLSENRVQGFWDILFSYILPAVANIESNNPNKKLENEPEDQSLMPGGVVEASQLSEAE